jgi:hypothetical protein
MIASLQARYGFTAMPFTCHPRRGAVCLRRPQRSRRPAPSRLTVRGP